MKLLPLLMVVLLGSTVVAQPRNQAPETPPPALPTEELAKYILYLQETGQLPTPPIAAPQQQKPPAGVDKNELEAAKFREATTGIFTGVINVFAGATLGNPIQIVSGILSALSAVINVVVKSTRFASDEEREERTKELASRIHRIIKDRPLKRTV